MFRKPATTLLGLVSLAALSGCGLLFGDPADEAPPGIQEKEEPAVVDEILATVEPLASEDGLPTSEELFDVLLEAGYPEKAIEATQDSSPLQNEVPAKMFAVKVDEGCVIGEIRDGKSRASLYPPTESMGNCLMGTVDRPEGAGDPKGDEVDEGDDDNGVGHLPGDDMHDRKDGKPSGEKSGSGMPGEDEESGSNGGSDDSGESGAVEDTHEGPSTIGGN